MRLTLLNTKHQGVTLVEILVALVVMSIGLLGLAALQSDALRSSNVAIMQTKAIHFATDIADRIRANPTAGEDYAIALADAAPVLGLDCYGDFNIGDAICTPAQMADADVKYWLDALADTKTGIPGGDGSIVVCTDTNVNTVAECQALDDDSDPLTDIDGSCCRPAVSIITVVWNERGTNRSYQLMTQ